MSECEAVTLAQNKLRDSPQEGAIYLVKALDCIPLAIIQAAAYINRLGSRMSAAKYLGELHGVEGQVRLLQKAASDMRRDEEAQKSVLATWQISFEYLRNKRSSAANLLSFMCFFNRQGYPEFMIRHYTDTDGRDTSSSTGLAGGNVDLEEDIAMLRQFSLLNAAEDKDEFEMHGLVQLATRIWLRTAGSEDRWRSMFVRAMSLEFPTGEYTNWPRCRLLFPHALAWSSRGWTMNETKSGRCR